MIKYISSRNVNDDVTSSLAIIRGLTNDGGLYTPYGIDATLFNLAELIDISKKNPGNLYKNIALYVFKYFLNEFSDAELENAIDDAYNKFYKKDITPIKKVGDDFILELFNGPTSAFKDIALTMLPHLLSLSYQKQNINKKIYILCATSGDTGKAALEGFKDVDNTYITVFYPHNAVSKIQELQMTTTTGHNTNVVSVNGNFDDCQKIVKNIMTNRNELLLNKNVLFSSANSINLGRLIPQVTYYIYTYVKLLIDGDINENEKINFVVPSGNFGNILAGYIAKTLGCPINKLICASNKNNVLTDFINTGIYDKNRNFYNTISPSMDILVSSNLERLLFMKSDYNADLINDYFNQLSTIGKYQVNNKLLESIKNDFSAYYADETEIINVIKSTFFDYNYLIDPHTGCGMVATKKYKNETNDTTKNIILSTASPFKFPKTVLNAINSESANLNDFDAINKLSKLSNTEIPKNLLNIDQMKVLHDKNIDINDATTYITNKINELNS